MKPAMKLEEYAHMLGPTKMNMWQEIRHVRDARSSTLQSLVCLAKMIRRRIKGLKP